VDLSSQVLTAKVMHQRFFPQKNSFNYNVYYLVLPLPAPRISHWFATFEPRDLGFRDGRDPSVWAKKILAQHHLSDLVDKMMLITMPRVLGYVFNPVSFYLCFDHKKQLRVVIAEVHNTFGEQHSYVCAHADHSVIGAQDWLEAEKCFHVSPFLQRNGHYRFRFSVNKNSLDVGIDYFDSEKNKQLLTLLTGTLSPLTTSTVRKLFWSHKLLTFRVIILIHWQALKLIWKKIPYVPKPKLRSESQTSSHKSSRS
jgi:DUF1365 family protein